MPDKPTILVVDDDEPIVTLMSSLLRQFGYEPVTALSGPEALQAAQRHPPALVLLDKNMPGMSGEEVVRALRAQPAFARLPILILSGEPVSKQEIAAIGANSAVMKPFDIPALLEEIKKFTGSEAT